MADVFYPAPGFYFRLQFDGGKTELDNAFQEASGLSAPWQTEEVRQGGQNKYQHQLPTVVKHSNLVLRRGFMSRSSELADWCAATRATDFSTPLIPRNLLLSLHNEAGTRLASWSFQQAWPVKWSMSDFTSQENALAIETLEFAFSRFQQL